MPDEAGRKSSAASPYATGGGGARLEHRLGAVFLVRLLTAGPVLELDERAPDRVAFQRAPAAIADDLVVTARAEDGSASIRLDIAVRRTPKFVRSDIKTTELVKVLVRADLSAERSADPLVERRLAVAVSGPQTHAQEIAELAEVARGQSNADEFVELVRTPGKFRTRQRLDHLIDMVAGALDGIGDEDARTPEHRCWRLLQRLWMMQVNLETGHEGDWTRLVGDLRPVALGHTQEHALALRNRIEQLSAKFDITGGNLDVLTLRRRLHGALAPGSHVAPQGWTSLLALDKQTRTTVARSLASGSSNEMTLPRSAIREELRAALAADGDLVVVGDSGVGKSALVMDAIAPDRLGADRQAVAVNLRHLPASQLELLALLSSPVEVLLSELTAPERLLVIDGAEAAAEEHADVFSYCVRAAREAGVRVVAVTTTEGAAVVRRLLRSGTEDPRECAVAGLTDDEIYAVAAYYPALRRLVDDPRARELLRRPIVVDLLDQAGDPGLPLSESQALDHIWQHLVRNSGRRDQGSPDARENVMLSLAGHAFRKGDTGDLLARLDHDAVDGLRRTGVLQPTSQLPWERVPSFRHDLLRAYSVARLLLEERDPAASLTAMGAARWTLPSARLACEIALSAPDEPLYPRAGRFAALQAGFDDIAAAGGGQRWSDVPTEALLVAPDPAVLLSGAWPTVVMDEAQGIARIIRILDVRHRRSGVLDPIIAEPVIARLLDAGTPPTVQPEAAKLIRDWLRALVMAATPARHPVRVRLREVIVGQCAEKERVLDEQEAARRAELAARTPEQVAEDEAQRRRFAAFSGSSRSRRRRRRPEPKRHRPYLWIDDAQVEHLALLGPDLGEDGEAILRRIAEDEPHWLKHAVEPLLAGHSLANYSTELLVALAAAYYIDEPEEDEDDDGFGSYGGMHDDGIRDHDFFALGLPLAHFAKGPFLALFRADYLRGVSLLNRMLNHGALCRVRSLSGLRYRPSAEDHEEAKQVLSISGEPREYIGDGHVWLWYRGTGVGPYPCMSALQALELVTEECILAGVPPQAVASIMLEDAHNLAMPALALGVLVRHLEVVGDTLDPYLVEPAIWELEFSRSVADQSSGLAAHIPDLPHLERRRWNLREVGMMLALTADADRTARLKAVGERLQDRARAQVGDDSSAEALEHLAAVRTWPSVSAWL